MNPDGAPEQPTLRELLEQSRQILKETERALDRPGALAERVEDLRRLRAESARLRKRIDEALRRNQSQ